MTSTFDLSPQFFQYLTPHLLAPLLKTLQTKNIYPVEFILKQRYNVLSQTQYYSALLTLLSEHPTLPQDKKVEFEQQQAAYETKRTTMFTSLPTTIQTTLTDLEKLDQRSLLNWKPGMTPTDGNEQQSKSLFTSPLTLENLQSLSQYASLCVDGGYYFSGAIAYLYYYLAADGLTQISKETVWKMVEASLLCEQHHMALYEVFIRKLRELIDTASSSLTLAQQSQQRVTYAVFCLYAFTTNPPSNVLLSIRSIWSDVIYSQQISTSPLQSLQINNERLLNAILYAAPSLLRYVVLSTIIAAKVPASPTTPWLLKRSPFFRELSRILQIQFPSSSPSQKDPIIKFFQQLLIEFDVQSAITTLNTEIPMVFEQDPFLTSHPLKLEFFEACKAVLIDTVLKLNTNFTLPQLQSMIQLDIKCEDFDNTITLVDTKPATTTTTTPEGTEKSTDEQSTTTTPTTTTPAPTDGTDKQQQPQQTTTVIPTIFISPLLSKGDVNHSLLKKVKNQAKAR